MKDINMNNKNSKKNEDFLEVDLKRLWNAVWHRLWLVVIAAVLCAALFFAYTVFFITPQYNCSAMFYVNNSSISIGGSVDITNADIVASKSLVDTYIVILNSRSCLTDVIDYADLNYSTTTLRNMLEASAVNETEVFEVIITGPNPEENKRIADAIAYILPNKISEIVEGTSAKVVDYAIVATSPASPNRTNNMIIGFIVGFVISVGLIVILEIFDNTVRSEEDIIQISALPVLAAVPDMMAPSKGNYYYDGYVKKKGKKNAEKNTDVSKKAVLVGDGISFAATEAYKLLRTKIEFSFADDKKCRVLGVSSALAGEGKSLSSVNLAHSFSQLDKRVLLIDCDMRRPSLATKLNIERVPGLSNYLTGRNSITDIIQTCDEQFETSVFHVIAAGRIPPNPIELLSSNRMKELLDALREHYDYIILDLPPVGEVSDAIVAADLVDGVLMVVCQNYCTRKSFSRAVEQFDFVESRILGVVLNRVSENGKRYGYKYGKHYYKKYYGYSSYSSAPKEE